MLANWSRWRGPGEEGPVTTDQILFGVGLILVLATASQVLAVRLRVPALIILLPAGFIAGALTTDVNPQRLLGGGVPAASPSFRAMDL
jgi:Kef-type K+ transport system membrane component KefB